MKLILICFLSILTGMLMRRLYFLFLITASFLTVAGCGKSCPDGMTEKKLEYGTKICVPENL
ncbi:hypothetical protein EIM50_21090 [Pseudoxanthomonas sp. SGD-10]|nr:hypothetical protein EIM50_21090 [Pseudoxanthomonas sp. SGD-10]